MQQHYVCSQCGFTSHFAGTCQNDDCIKQGMALSPCHCEDGKHTAIMDAYREGSVEDSISDSGELHNTSSDINTIDLDNGGDQ